MTVGDAPDHGGGVDAAAATFGGARDDWIDLSTGINPVPYPLPGFGMRDWATLPDARATAALQDAARRFWNIPPSAAVLAAPGASSLIARIPALWPGGTVCIRDPVYNEHGRAFAAAGWTVGQQVGAKAQVLVHPNNPDGRLWATSDVAGDLCIIDESFCDVTPAHSLMALANRPGVIILKSFGKFWGLAGMRLGFAIGDPGLIGRLGRMLGPWPVSGPALATGALALQDMAWADAARARLAADAARLDGLVTAVGPTLLGGTSLFRLYDTEDAVDLQHRLARHQIWSRTFPYSSRWLRLGLPGSDADWARLSGAMARVGTGRMVGVGQHVEGGR